MRIKSIEIGNFKAINSAKIDLADFNVIVGANGSGKSSILQAMHWMFQSGRNRRVEARSKSSDGVTLSEKNATYMPSPDYRNAGYSSEYGNKTGTPQFDMSVIATMDDESEVTAELWIKSARNEGILVHIPSGNAFISKLRDPNREFCAYIPGLAGIPLNEERRSQAIVHRLAAAGDANTVLRNVLLLLKGKEINGKNGLILLEEYASKIIGNISLDIEFSDERDSTISARFTTAEMTSLERKWKPLELAGIGFLQVIQIFAYLLYYRPALLLVDEPDAHLHPTAQEQLIPVLVAASQKTDTQVVLTTHSPSVIRALPSAAHVIWMREGKVQDGGNNQGRQLMGWGLLDRKILMLTEDEDASMIRTILSQWPHIDRAVAVWPVRGSSKVPEADVIKDFIELAAGSLKVVIHRDRDFLMPAELTALSDPYIKKGLVFWFTKNSDMEAYWTNEQVIASHFEISEEEAINLLNSAITKASENNVSLETRRKKRNDAQNKLNKNGYLPQFSDLEVEQEAAKGGIQYAILGKDLRNKIRNAAQEMGLKGINNYSSVIPAALSGKIADDFKELLENVLNR